MALGGEGIIIVKRRTCFGEMEMFYVIMSSGYIAVSIHQNFLTEISMPFSVWNLYFKWRPIIIIIIVIIILTHKIVVIVIIVVNITEWEISQGIDTWKWQNVCNYWNCVMIGGNSLYCSVYFICIHYFL